MESLVKEDMGGIHRTLLCQGPVKLTRGTKTNKRHLSLFNDVLVVSSNLNKKKFKIKCIIPLNNLYAVENVELGRKNETSPCKSLFLFWRDGSFLASFRSIEQKDHWYYYLRRSIDAAKKDVTKPFTLRIFTEAIPTCDSPLYVTATNIDNVSDIIQKLLPMIRMPNSEDYQLWFCPGHEEAPRALQGYEYPHKILRTHLQNTFRTSNSKLSTAFPILPGLFVKDLNVDTEAKFILKPQYSARSQQQDEKERPCKERRPFMTSCFHWGSVPHQDQMCTVSTVNNQGKLFGQELSSICVDGKWPTAILDILYRLREKGPTTHGIFLLSPNENSCKALKDKLDSGQEVDLKNQSVHDVAWILKEFLRNIKGSLMTSRLYDKWLAVSKIGNDEEKLGAVQSLVEQLPEPNAALLGQIFRMLHEISRNFSTNLMTSISLAIELAPCILWIPSYYFKVLSDFTAEKISLVKFIIDNSPKIFGVDDIALWYETSFYHPYGKNSSSYKNNPSIINNINQTENELSGCPSGRTYIPGQYALPKRPVATLQCETSIENQEGKVDTSQEEISPTPPTPIKKQVFCKFPPIAHLERMLPSPILDMLSTIAERGQNSNEVFRFISKNSHWSLRDKIYTEQQINWNEECVLTVASVLKDLIRNIKGSLLSSDLYENWISVLDEKSLLGKIAAIQSILPKMPQANRLLLKELIRVLLKIKTSTMNHLDTFIISVRIAPHVLWDPTCPTSYFGWDLSKKISIIEIMIDNYVDIFGNEDHIICDHNEKRSDIIKTSVNTAAEDNETTSTYYFPQWKPLYD